jgi:hypothetical protein
VVLEWSWIEPKNEKIKKHECVDVCTWCNPVHTVALFLNLNIV